MLGLWSLISCLCECQWEVLYWAQETNQEVGGRIEHRHLQDTSWRWWSPTHCTVTCTRLDPDNASWLEEGPCWGRSFFSFSRGQLFVRNRMERGQVVCWGKAVLHLVMIPATSLPQLFPAHGDGCTLPPVFMLEEADATQSQMLTTCSLSSGVRVSTFLAFFQSLWGGQIQGRSQKVFICFLESHRLARWCLPFSLDTCSHFPVPPSSPMSLGVEPYFRTLPEVWWEMS